MGFMRRIVCYLTNKSDVLDPLTKAAVAIMTFKTASQWPVENNAVFGQYFERRWVSLSLSLSLSLTTK